MREGKRSEETRWRICFYSRLPRVSVGTTLSHPHALWSRRHSPYLSFQWRTDEGGPAKHSTASTPPVTGSGWACTKPNQCEPRVGLLSNSSREKKSSYFTLEFLNSNHVSIELSCYWPSLLYCAQSPPENELPQKKAELNDGKKKKTNRLLMTLCSSAYFCHEWKPS